jgi:hypothetical protein
MQILARGSRAGVEEQGDQTLIRVVEREIDRNRVLVAVFHTGTGEQHRVHVGPLGEPPALLVQRLHLLAGPVEVVTVMPLEHPVRRQIGAGIDGNRDLAVSGDAKVLQLARGHPPPPGEEPRPDHAPRVEMVPLVPAVVGHFVAPVRLHQREEHASHPDR